MSTASGDGSNSTDVTAASPARNSVAIAFASSAGGLKALTRVLGALLPWLVVRIAGRWFGEVVHTRRNGSLVTVFTRWVLDRDADSDAHFRVVDGELHDVGADAAALPALVLTLAFSWATSVARSHDPISWERATEKNKNI